MLTYVQTRLCHFRLFVAPHVQPNAAVAMNGRRRLHHLSSPSQAVTAVSQPIVKSTVVYVLSLPLFASRRTMMALEQVHNFLYITAQMRACGLSSHPFLCLPLLLFLIPLYAKLWLVISPYSFVLRAETIAVFVHEFFSLIYYWPAYTKRRATAD